MANEFIATHDNDCELCNINISSNVNDVSLNSKKITPDEIENVVKRYQKINLLVLMVF